MMNEFGKGKAWIFDVPDEVAELGEGWSDKYKKSINCSNPKGFSQKAHCAGRKKKESINEETINIKPIITPAIKKLDKIFKDNDYEVRIVGGADRVGEFEKLANNYNGKLYQFDNLEVMSAGDRDPDGEGVEGMSASKQRKAAAEGDLKAFMKGVPKSMSQKDAEQLFKKVRSAMDIKEDWNLWEIAPKFDWKGLRENYISDRIYQIGQLVENLNTGVIGRIIRRGDKSFNMCCRE